MGSADFDELLYWGVIFVVLIVLLFIANRFFSWSIGSRLRNANPTFGMDITDVEKLRKKGGLTPEEEKAIRAAMSRRMLERVRTEEKLRSLPSNAPELLARIDAETARKMKETEDPGILPKPLAIRPAPSPTGPPASEPLPPEFDAFKNRPDHELDDLVRAGFLSDSDVRRIRESRTRT